MLKLSSVLMFLTAAIVGAGLYTNHDHTLCEGILPPNDMKIPAFGIMATEANVTEEDFNDVLDDIEAYYSVVIERLGRNLVVNRLWTNETVNASAQQRGSSYIINMYGGLARHPAITKDAFMLVACHEIGHHLAGAPKYSGWFNTWASNEGQSDYFATLRCMRFMLGERNNTQWVEENVVDEFAMQKCQEIYNTQEDENLCARLSMAGFSLVSLFKDMKDLPDELSFRTPDGSQVPGTSDDHPDPQCRLDTYFQGALCVNDLDEELSDTDPNVGTCNRAGGATNGLRPRCWFAPRRGLEEGLQQQLSFTNLGEFISKAVN